jgi:hypothetical protein
MATRRRQLKRALEVTGVARRTGLLRVLREIGVRGRREVSPESAREFRLALEELELRRKLPRYHWRPLSGIRTGEALGDLQRIAVLHNVRLPTSFALVGKTLAQADSIARTLDPELDPVQLLDDEGTELMLREAERRLEPNQLFAYLFTQIAPAARLPAREPGGRAPPSARPRTVSAPP